jgi:hypothetical protein
MLRILLLFVIVFSQACIAEESQLKAFAQKFKEYEEKKEREKHVAAEDAAKLQEGIKFLESKMTFVKDAVIRKNGRRLTEYPPTGTNKQAMFTSVGEKEDFIKALQKQIDNLKKEITEKPAIQKHPPPMLDFPFKLGDIGFLYQADVAQVLGRDKLLVTYYYEAPKYIVRKDTNGNESALKTFDFKSFLFIAKEIDTTGMTDGANFTVNSPFEVVGTETYIKTNGGSNTVFVLKPFDMKRLEALKIP